MALDKSLPSYSMNNQLVGCSYVIHLVHLLFMALGTNEHNEVITTIIVSLLPSLLSWYVG